MLVIKFLWKHPHRWGPDPSSIRPWSWRVAQKNEWVWHKAQQQKVYCALFWPAVCLPLLGQCKGFFTQNFIYKSFYCWLWENTKLHSSPMLTLKKWDILVKLLCCASAVPCGALSCALLCPVVSIINVNVMAVFGIWKRITKNCCDCNNLLTYTSTWLSLSVDFGFEIWTNKWQQVSIISLLET